MARQSGPIEAQWLRDDADRQQILERVRHCARLTKPWILPPLGMTHQERLPDNFQSIGSRGITNLEGRMLMALFPPDLPWFHLDLDPAILYDDRIPADEKQAARDTLAIHAAQIQATIESAGIGTPYAAAGGHRNAMRMALTQVLVTGDVLFKIDDEYRVTVYRRDQYVTRRNTRGDVAYHIVREMVDPCALGEEICRKAGLDHAELHKKSVQERELPLHTRAEYRPHEPEAERWVTEQELNGATINTSADPISAFFCVPFELVSGEHYGRGFTELNRGDLHSSDTLNMHLLDFAGLCAKATPAIDEGSEVKEDDLAKPSGVPIRARVKGGVVDDVGFIRVDKLGDFRCAQEQLNTIEGRLAKSMLMASDSVRDSERTTRYEIAEVTIKELDGALGGFYAPVADNMQIHPLRRVIYQMERDKLLRPLPKHAVKFQFLTGIAALARLAMANRLLEFADIVNTLGDEAKAWIDMGVMLRVQARYRNITEPGLVKTPEQRAKEQAEAAKMQIALMAAEQGIKSTGAVAEAQLTAAPTGAAQ